MLKYFEYVWITLAKTIDQLSLTDQDMENTFSGELMPSVEGIQVGHLSLIHRVLTGHEWPRYRKIRLMAEILHHLGCMKPYK